MPATSVRELARRIGVSPATVSRVLNDRPGVSPRLRAKVLDAVREEGYPTAGGPGRSSPFVGIIVPELDNPAFSALAFAIETRLARVGVTGLIGSSTLVGYAEDSYVETLLRHGAHGLVLVSGSHGNAEADHSLYRRLSRRRVSMVLVSGLVEGLAVPSVGTDEAAGARLAVRHLWELGHRRIGLAGGERFYRPSIHRLAGYTAALRELAADAEEIVAEGVYTLEGGRSATADLLRRGATAVVAGSDLMAYGAVRAVRDAGLRVPQDVSVVGYDDTALAPLGDPPLTTVRQPLGRISAAVAGAMAAQLDGHRPAQLHLRLEPTLVVRSSTGAAPRAARGRGGRR